MKRAFGEAYGYCLGQGCGCATLLFLFFLLVTIVGSN
jgi:hypothetical protein